MQRAIIGPPVTRGRENREVRAVMLSLCADLGRSRNPVPLARSPFRAYRREVRDPIHDDAIREDLDQLGLRHFLDVRATSRAMLGGLAGRQRAAFAAAVAERLLHEHHHLPERERAESVCHWRPVLDVIWSGLCGQRDGKLVLAEVAEAVGCFYLSPAYQGRRHDDPRDAADHAAMGAFYAAECYLHGCVEFASWAGWRGFDAAAVRAASDREWPHRRPVDFELQAWELAHPTIQAELDHQLADLELLDAEGWTLDGTADGCADLVDQLRSGELSEPVVAQGSDYEPGGPPDAGNSAPPAGDESL